MGNPFFFKEEEGAIIHEIDNQNHNIIPFHHPKQSSSTRKVSLTASKYSTKRNTYMHNKRKHSRINARMSSLTCCDKEGGGGGGGGGGGWFWFCRVTQASTCMTLP